MRRLLTLAAIITALVGCGDTIIVQAERDGGAATGAGDGGARADSSGDEDNGPASVLFGGDSGKPEQPDEDDDDDGVPNGTDDNRCAAGDLDRDEDGWADACDLVLWARSVEWADAPVATSLYSQIRVRPHEGDARISSPYMLDGVVHTVDEYPVGISGAMAAEPSESGILVNPWDADGMVYEFEALPTFSNTKPMRLVFIGTVDGTKAIATWELRGFPCGAFCSEY